MTAVATTSTPLRETFGSRLGLVLSMMGVAVGLGNVWRFPYMVGEFGGAPFVLFYVAVVCLVGIPALIAEWALGRHTGRGPVGAFARAGLPGGHAFGWLLFATTLGATAYYINAIGWVTYYGLAELAHASGWSFSASAVLPPDEGVDAGASIRQAVLSGGLATACAVIVARGLRRGIERASEILMPLLFVSLLLLVARSLTLEGAWEGVRWYALKFDTAALTPRVMIAALGQAFFSLSLGGTFMVVYGSYLGPRDRLASNAVITALGDMGVGLLAGLAIIPAVFALGLTPEGGPSLVFQTLPKVFDELWLGWAFGAAFFLGLAGAAFLSAVANFEVLVAALGDERKWSRRRAAFAIALAVFLLGAAPAANMKLFGIWDLTFGSGMQTLGGLVAVLTFAWSLDKSRALAELTRAESGRRYAWLYYWLRFVVPATIAFVGVYWVLSDVLGVVSAV